MTERTYGGRLLALMRTDRGLTHEQVALESGMIATRTISNLETGKSAYPKRETLENLLECYDPTFNEVQQVLKAFGYLPEYPLPSAEDVDAIVAQTLPTLGAAAIPAYLVDFMTHIHAWNGKFVALTGLVGDELNSLMGRTIWEMAYEEAEADPENLDPELLEEAGQMRLRLAIYIGEPWFEAFLKEVGEPFLTYWHAAEAIVLDENQPLTLFETPLLQASMFTLPDVSHDLNFFAKEESIPTDDRFRLCYLMPADSPTMRWLEEMKGDCGGGEPETQMSQAL